MEKKEILFGVLIFGILFFSLIFTGVQALAGSDIGCEGVRQYSASYQRQFCEVGNDNYNPYYCSCVGGSSGDSGNTPVIPAHTEQDTLDELENGLNWAYNTNEEEQNYDWDSLTDSQKAKAQYFFDNKVAFYENFAEQNGADKYSLLLNGIQDLKDRVGEEGLPPVIRARELSIPLVEDIRNYKAEISTHGYPNLEFLSQNPQFATLTFWHGEDGKVHYYYDDNTESVYSDTQQPIPFEGFGVHQGEEIEMPKMATYLGEPGITASTDYLDWGQITFVTVPNAVSKIPTLHPTVQVNEDADIRMKNFNVIIKDKNGNVIDSIPLVADIQPKNSGGLVVYSKGEGLFGNFPYYFCLAFAIFFVSMIVWAVLRDKKNIQNLKNFNKKKKQLVQFKSNIIWLIVECVGMIIAIYGFYFCSSLELNGRFWFGMLLLIGGAIIAIIGMSKYSPPKNADEIENEEVKK